DGIRDGHVTGVQTCALPICAAGEQVRVTIRDDGVGMTPEMAGRIFDPFFTTKDVGGGTGLGLAISHGVVAAHGGRIEVESAPGKGATFRVPLPLAAPAASRDRAASGPGKGSRRR